MLELAIKYAINDFGKNKRTSKYLLFQTQDNTLLNSSGSVTVTRSNSHTLVFERNTAESSGELQRTQAWVRYCER